MLRFLAGDAPAGGASYTTGSCFSLDGGSTA